MRFSNQELLDIVLIYGETGGSATKTQRLYQTRFPHRRRPSTKLIVDTVFRLREKGTLQPDYEGRGRKKTLKVILAQKKLRDIVRENPNVSTRVAAKLAGVSHSVVHKTFQKNLSNRCNVKQTLLTEEDCNSRLKFATWFRQKQINDPDFFVKVLFNGECRFTRRGISKIHGSPWTNKNLYIIQPDHFFVNIWMGIVDDVLLGPHILPAELTAETYLHFLQNSLQKYLQILPTQKLERLIFMHDGAAPYISQSVRDFITEMFPQWIGCGGQTSWSSRSPDLNPIDFFLWSYMESLVYDGEGDIGSEEDLRKRIFNAAIHIQGEAGNSQWIRESLLRHMEACIRVEGRPFVHLL
ncbi:hypothetical protein Trydic_g187 [Trypoxylus dichotomus]